MGDTDQDTRLPYSNEDFIGYSNLAELVIVKSLVKDYLQVYFKGESMVRFIDLSVEFKGEGF